MPGMGKGHAASVSASFRSSFDGVKLAIIVGICGAVLTANGHDIRLGDEIVAYDHGRIYPTGLEMRTDSIIRSNTEVQAFLHKVKTRKGGDKILLQARHHFTLLQARDQNYARPSEDRLFYPNYHHKHHTPSRFFPRINSSFQFAQVHIKQHRKHLPRDMNAKTTLRTQRVIFSSNLHTMVTDASKLLDLGPDIIKDPRHPIWNDTLTHQDLMDHLGESYSNCLDLILAIEAKLQELAFMASNLCCNTFTVSDRAALQPFKDAVEDLKSLIGVFASFVPPREETRQLDTPRNQTKMEVPLEFEHFRTVQEAACSLYNALGVAFSSHTLHEADFSLQPTLSGTSTQIRFNIAIRGPKKAKERPSRTTIWVNVESIMEPPETSTHSGPRSSSPEVSALKRYREAPISPTAEAPKTPKRVRFHTARPGPPMPAFTADVIRAIPDLYLQGNLCTIVERLSKQRPLKCGDCIGQLGAAPSCRHLLYMANWKATTPVSLSQLISLSTSNSTKSLGLYERVRLSKHLATALLYYHATPWLNRPWRSADILFFGKSHKLLEQVTDAIPYMSTSINASSLSNDAPSASSEYDRIIRNPVLFGLGHAARARLSGTYLGSPEANRSNPGTNARLRGLFYCPASGRRE
ncbi:hypothetical protein BJX62DRAFT_236306 [Aspergillus germanicus]